LKFFCTAIFCISILLSSCGGPDSNGRATTSSFTTVSDTFADFPKFGELPTDIVLHPPPLTSAEIDRLRAIRRKSGEDLVTCLKEKGWDVSLERNFPTFVDFLIPDQSAGPWPAESLSRLRDPNSKASVTGELNNNSTRDDAKTVLEKVSAEYPGYLPGRDDHVDTNPSFANDAEKQRYSDDYAKCMEILYQGNVSLRDVSANISELAEKIFNDPNYARLVDRRIFSKCTEAKGFDPEKDPIELVLAPIRDWVVNDKKPDLDEVHRIEKSIYLAWAECKFENFREIREIEISYNRDAGLL